MTFWEDKGIHLIFLIITPPHMNIYIFCFRRNDCITYQKSCSFSSQLWLHSLVSFVLLCYLALYHEHAGHPLTRLPSIIILTFRKLYLLSPGQWYFKIHHYYSPTVNKNTLLVIVTSLSLVFTIYKVINISQSEICSGHLVLSQKKSTFQ